MPLMLKPSLSLLRLDADGCSIVFFASSSVTACSWLRLTWANLGRQLREPLGGCKYMALSLLPMHQNCVCFESSQCNASVFIIAPLSCLAPIYKDLLGSPLHLKFSFISPCDTAELQTAGAPFCLQLDERQTFGPWFLHQAWDRCHCRG